MACRVLDIQTRCQARTMFPVSFLLFRMYPCEIYVLLVQQAAPPAKKVKAAAPAKKAAAAKADSSSEEESSDEVRISATHLQLSSALGSLSGCVSPAPELTCIQEEASRAQLEP